MSETLLNIENVKKSFKDVHAVNNVDLKIVKGQNISLVGESGSGKSTLARLIMKLYLSDQGSMTFDDHDLAQLRGKQLKDVYRHVQMVFQDPYSSLDPRFNVRRILSEALTLLNPNERREVNVEALMKELLEAVNLSSDILMRYPHEFSGGERQRIAIARALMVKPKLLILDEAVSSLDVLIQAQIINLLFDLQKKYDLTYFFISHNLKVVQKLSHQVAVMYKGKIVEYASTQMIFENPQHAYTKQLLAAALDYKPVELSEDLNLSDTSQLKDLGGGHFVRV